MVEQLCVQQCTLKFRFVLLSLRFRLSLQEYTALETPVAGLPTSVIDQAYDLQTEGQNPSLLEYAQALSRKHNKPNVRRNTQMQNIRRAWQHRLLHRSMTSPPTLSLPSETPQTTVHAGQIPKTTKTKTKRQKRGGTEKRKTGNFRGKVARFDLIP